MRIQQNYITKYNMNRPKLSDKVLNEEDITAISNDVRNISNKDLKKTLIDLGKNITKDSK